VVSVNLIVLCDRNFVRQHRRTFLVGTSCCYTFQMHFYLKYVTLRSYKRQFLLHPMLLSGKVGEIQVLTAASMKVTVLWDVAPYSLAEDYQSFRGVYCLPSSGQ
jgi:hypothetical protein